MVITGTLEEWRTSTGLPFQSPGEVEVLGALVPVLCMLRHDYAVYVELGTSGCGTGYEARRGPHSAPRLSAYC